jgi:hypothetical protein
MEKSDKSIGYSIQSKARFSVFFNPKLNGINELKQLFKNNGFDCPVFMDMENTIMKLNNFPKEQDFRCFLLDRDNKVVMVGNPVLNPGIWALYKKIINGKPFGRVNRE